MSPVQEQRVEATVEPEVEISVAAIGTYARLLRAVGRRIHTHGTCDGGLICEDRTARARPTMWRILGDGTLIADTPYSFSRRGFIPAQLPV